MCSSDLGWSTYGGDHMAMYDVNAGLPKTVIKRMIADIAACDLVSEKLKEALVNVLKRTNFSGIAAA